MRHRHCITDRGGHNNEADLAFVPGTPRSGSSTSSADSATTVAVASALGAREWLSDVHIANLMFLLLHGQLALPLEMRDLFQCIYPMTDELFVQMLGRSDSGTLLTHAKTGGGVTFAFINPNNNHWRLVVLDGMHREVVLFDPLGTAFPQAVMDAISTCMGSAFHMLDLRSCLQAEGWNCGVWVLFIASRYVRRVSAAAWTGSMADERQHSSSLATTRTSTSCWMHTAAASNVNRTGGLRNN